jgi:hypothetical protein
MSALATAAFALAVGSAARATDKSCQMHLASWSRIIGSFERFKNRDCVYAAAASDIDACVDAEGLKSAEKRIRLTEMFLPGERCDPVPAIGVNAAGATPGTDAALGVEQAPRPV